MLSEPLSVTLTAPFTRTLPLNEAVSKVVSTACSLFSLEVTVPAAEKVSLFVSERLAVPLTTTWPTIAAVSVFSSVKLADPETITLPDSEAISTFVSVTAKLPFTRTCPQAPSL
jgi:hypothetical protein